MSNAAASAASASDAAQASTPRIVDENLLRSVRDGTCILFLGAGVHYPPPAGSPYAYPEDQRPPLGKGLAAEIVKSCNCATNPNCPRDRDDPDDPGELQRVSLCYENEHDRMELVKLIRRVVEETTKPSAVVRGLAELPFPLVITTNYDTLFETALYAAGKKPVVGCFDPKGDNPTADYPGDPTAGSPFVFKAHGDIKDPPSIVITDEDYIGFVMRMGATESSHPIPQTFRFRFSKWPTLFVGYSLVDYNLRLLFRTLRFKIDKSERPSSYSLDLRPDPLIRYVWEKDQGFRFIAEDVWTFVPWLYHEVLGTEMPL